MTTRVLICDDSSLARKQMARALPANWNANITFAIDGRDALEKLRAGAGDLMFLDLNMPEMDGYQVLEAVLKEDLPVLTIVVSGDIQPEARKRVRKLGAIDFIKKPTDTDLVVKLLQDYGFLRPEDLAPVTEQPDDQKAEPVPSDSPIALNDYLQEVANVAMGRSSDLLARLLRVFVKQPIPRVEMIARSELSMAISAAQDDSSYSAVCQGFTGSGIAGEALLLFSDASFNDMAELLHYEDMDTETIQVEVLMDMSSILFGAFLKGIGDQLDLKLGLGHPTVLGQHRQIGDLLEHHSTRQEKLLCIEISYELEDRDISCDMLVLLTEDSVPFLEQRLPVPGGLIMAMNDIEASTFHWLIDMLESVEVGLVVLDLDFRVQAWNGFMEHHSGITASKVRDHVLFDVFPDIPKAWLTRKVDSVAMLNTRAFTSWEQRPYLFQFRNTRPITGTEDYMFQNLTISPLAGPDGKVDKICLMIYDVTDIATSKRALEKANQQLAKLSMTDRLTGLLNRGTWENLIDAEFERYRRYGHPTCLVMFDIDHFKPVNDTYGHLAGDEVIKYTARVMRDSLRQADSPGRYGGEEFGIILPETDEEGARIICERIRETIQNSAVQTTAAPIQYTVSIGIAPLTDGPENHMQWLQQADEALYAAKEGGRNRVVVFGGGGD